MTLTRPRLLLLPGEAPLDASLVESLRGAFDVVLVPDAATAARLSREDPTALVMAPSLILPKLVSRVAPDATSAILQHLGEGVGVVDASGSYTWTNDRLREYPEQVRRRFAELCRDAVAGFNRGGERTLKFSFAAGDAHYELVTSPAAPPAAAGTGGARTPINSVVGVLWDVTSTRRLLDKIDAIDAAGSELMRLDADQIVRLNAAERLRLLEEKIVRFAHDLLSFDDFEVRILDPHTNRLELVIARGITPVRIGEALYADAEGNGITGYVAATGESYLCANAADDPLYREGLDNAASSLTVPLRLHDRVIGTFNVESRRPAAFDENDRQFATIFGRYIAMAMNILNLLLVERYTTNEQAGQNVLSELARPLELITEQARALRDSNIPDGPTRKGLETILGSVEQVRRGIENCTSGARAVLGAEQEFFRAEPNPAMVGKRVLVADDDDNIRRNVASLLRQRGCQVTVCPNGSETIDVLRRQATRAFFDLVISDIKMPDRSGYEVFRATREISDTTPVILMTGFGYDPHHSIVRASQEGLQSFLFKPFKAQQLIAEVEKALLQDKKAVGQKR